MGLIEPLIEISEYKCFGDSLNNISFVITPDFFHLLNIGSTVLPKNVLI